MSVLIVGSEGSMGKRYQAILKHLGKEFHCRDIGRNTIPDKRISYDIDEIIIATPTDTHIEVIRHYLEYKKPILCEKPISKNMEQLKQIVKEIKEENISFQMMFQYKGLVPRLAIGKTYYDYFRHGNDGLAWDCLQIIGLAKDQITLREESPLWDCQINGHRLHLEFMDNAYVVAVESWLKGQPQDLGEILAVHEKTEAFHQSLKE